MKHVLIWMIGHYVGIGTGAAEFDSLIACQHARHRIHQAFSISLPGRANAGEVSVKKIKAALHDFAHWLGWTSGHVVSRWYRGHVWIGFRCAKCGRVDGAFRTPTSNRRMPDTDWDGWPLS